MDGLKATKSIQSYNYIEAGSTIEAGGSIKANSFIGAKNTIRGRWFNKQETSIEAGNLN